MELSKSCENVLEQNWRDGFTVPSPRLYPFQWNWDSGFIALGYLHTDVEKAFLELEHLFLGQWENGFLPHIIFHNAEKYGSDYFPSADYWKSSVSKYAPEAPKTTGISQPPVHGLILEMIFRKHGTSKRLSKLFDQIVHLHTYYYDFRDTKGNGLVNVCHNWETGMDNSPWWDETLQLIPEDELGSIVLDRKDTKVVDDYQETRPSDDEYRRYLWLLQTLQRDGYDGIPEQFPFQLWDLTFNSIFLASNHSLISIGRELGKNMDWLEAKTREGIASFNHYLWNSEDGIYYPYQVLLEKQIPLLGAACFLPLLAGVPSAEQANKMVGHLKKYDNLYGIPSFDPSQIQYEPKKYWRGPIWVNMNYLIWLGLEKYGFSEEATSLKERTLAMVKKYGIREYYPVDKNASSAYGATDFSWTASIMLDYLNAEQ